MKRAPIDLDEIPEEVLFDTIVSCKIKIRFDGVDIVREVAKRPEVRLLWSLSKGSNTPLFPGTLLDWNPMQKRLAYWLSFYSSVESSYDRPPSRVLENDALLDKWLQSKNEEAEKEFEKNWRQGTIKVQKSAMDHDEVFILGD